MSLLTDPRVYWKRRAENVKAHVRIGAVLGRYGIELVDGRVQAAIRCLFHGKDDTPSAMAYEQTDSVHCFRCKQSWDQIGYVQQAESASFTQAIALLEAWYGVPRLPDRLDPEAAARAVDDIWRGKTRADGEDPDGGRASLEGARESLERLLASVRGEIGPDDFLEALWVVDNAIWDVDQGNLEVSRCLEVVRRVRDRVRTCLPT